MWSLWTWLSATIAICRGRSPKAASWELSLAQYDDGRRARAVRLRMIQQPGAESGVPEHELTAVPDEITAVGEALGDEGTALQPPQLHGRRGPGGSRARHGSRGQEEAEPEARDESPKSAHLHGAYCTMKHDSAPR